MISAKIHIALKKLCKIIYNNYVINQFHNKNFAFVVVVVVKSMMTTNVKDKGDKVIK